MKPKELTRAIVQAFLVIILLYVVVEEGKEWGGGGGGRRRKNNNVVCFFVCVLRYIYLQNMSQCTKRCENTSINTRQNIY